MKVTTFDDRDIPLEDDVILFRQKPNPILYCIEATRIVLLYILCLSIVLVFLLHFARGAPIAFLVKLTLVLDCILFGIFISLLLLVASGIEFILTSKHAVIRFKPFGVGNRRLSIPIKDVASVEVRSYGPRYGSAYLERCGTGYNASPLRSISVKRVQDGASIWLSLPWSSPALAGFYGFRNYDAFASLICQLASSSGRVSASRSL